MMLDYTPLQRRLRVTNPPLILTEKDATRAVAAMRRQLRATAASLPTTLHPSQVTVTGTVDPACMAAYAQANGVVQQVSPIWPHDPIQYELLGTTEDWDYAEPVDALVHKMAPWHDDDDNVIGFTPPVNWLSWVVGGMMLATGCTAIMLTAILIGPHLFFLYTSLACVILLLIGTAQMINPR